MAWPHDLTPDIVAYFSPIPERDGFLEREPIVFPTVADASNLRTSDGSDGRFLPHKGKEIGAQAIKRQDTYKTGTSSRTGRAFDIVTGTVSDNWVSPITNCYGLLMADQTNGTTVEFISNTTTTGIEDCQMVIGRGHIPPVSASTTINKTNTYTYIYLAWGMSLDFRIAMEYGQPIRIDRTQDAWSTWEPCAICDRLGHTDKYLDHNNRDIALTVRANKLDNTLDVEVGDGNHLHATSFVVAYDPLHTGLGTATYPLPATGNIRVLASNSYCTFEYYPIRYQSLNSRRRVEHPRAVTHPNASNAKVVTNGRNVANSDQTVTPTVTNDGKSLQVDLNVAMPDAGDDLGSEDAPELVDATVVIPAQWAFDIDGTVDLRPSLYTRVIQMQAHQVFDDVSRMIYSSCDLILDNADGLYSGFWGERAVDIAVSTGNGWYKAFTGITDDRYGITLTKIETVGRIHVKCADFSLKMMEPIGQRIILDGMCVYNAVQLIAELCSIHPQYMQTIPKYIPPDCTADAPYGPAGSDCPYPILAKGSGTHARHEYGPEMLGWEIFQILVQDTGYVDPSTGLSIPFFGGFTLDGQLHFEPYNPTQYPPVAFYNEYDGTGLSQLEAISCNFNTSQMRTDIDFEGLDPYTYRLQYVHLEQPTEVKRATGRRKHWIERNPRYSDDYLVNSANVGAAMSSIPNVTPEVEVPFLPYVSAGSRVLVYDSNVLGDVLDGYITNLHYTIGMSDGTGLQAGYQIADSTATIRWIGNAPHL